MDEILWHRRETRRQTEKTNLVLQLGSPPPTRQGSCHRTASAERAPQLHRRTKRVVGRAFSPCYYSLSIRPGAAPQAGIGRTVGASSGRERIQDKKRKRTRSGKGRQQGQTRAGPWTLWTGWTGARGRRTCARGPSHRLDFGWPRLVRSVKAPWAELGAPGRCSAKRRIIVRRETDRGNYVWTSP